MAHFIFSAFCDESGETTYGVGQSSNITRATIRAVFSAINRLYGDRY